MISKLLDGLLLLLGLGAPLGVLGLLPRPEPGSPETTGQTPVRADTSTRHSGTRALAALAEEQTPFRPEGELPLLRFGETAPPPAPPAPVVERPKLAVSGIVWGADPVAIIEGVPGRDQPVALAPGASAGGFRVTRIEPERVTVSGMDTTWVLRVRTAW